MFFGEIGEIRKLAEGTNFTIFVLEDFLRVEEIYREFPKTTTILRPDEKTGKITVEAVREFTVGAGTKEREERFFIVEAAEKMNEAAENAFLKNLEEPKENNHFVLFVRDLSGLLPTVRSRARVFVQEIKNSLEKPIAGDEKVKTLAKRLITAKGGELVKLAEEINAAGKKENGRGFALGVVATGIEILYKSFFKTGNEKFLRKLSNLLELYENIEGNGHIKLHIVADML